VNRFRFILSSILAGGLTVRLEEFQGARPMPLSLTLLTTAFPPERHGAVVGIWGGPGGSFCSDAKAPCTSRGDSIACDEPRRQC
jgi:hypothetical protein